jgi:hypothetical protein
VQFVDLRVIEDHFYRELRARQGYDSDAVLHAFIGLDHDLETIFYENLLHPLVRYLCVYAESLVVLARSIKGDHLWLLAVSSRQSLLIAARQYLTVINRVRERQGITVLLKGTIIQRRL